MTESDRDLLARVRDRFARQPFMALLGAAVEAAAPGTVTLAMPFRADLTQQNGFLHGGAVMALADVAGGYAAFSVFPPGSDVLTVELKLNLLAPARGDRLRAVGAVLRAGGTLTVCEVRVHAEAAGMAPVLCAAGTQTLVRRDAARLPQGLSGGPTPV